MTWHAERVEGRPVDGARDKLLAQRKVLEDEAIALNAQPLRSKTQSAAIGRLEDLTAIAKKIKAIDKKLGREVG
jgi:hypothetical protein